MSPTVIILVAVGLVLVACFALRRFESLSGKTTDELCAVLRGSEWLFYRNTLLELRRRGEDIREEVIPVLDLLVSERQRQRIAGWLILRELYPDLAVRVPDYRPQESPAVCGEKTRKLFIQAG